MNTTIQIVQTWRERKATGQPCWCGKPNDHVGWPVCADRATPANAEHEVVMVEGRGYCEDCHPGRGLQRHNDWSGPESDECSHGWSVIKGEGCPESPACNRPEAAEPAAPRADGGTR